MLEFNKGILGHRLERLSGWIDYHYGIYDEYPSGLLILMGGYVDKDKRGHGVYTEMLHDLFNQYPIDTIVHAAVAHRGLVPMFERLGFKRVKRVEYWGESDDTVQMEGKIIEKKCK